MRHARKKLLIASIAVAVAVGSLASVAFGAEGELTFVECLKDTGTASTCSDQSGAVDGLAGSQGIAASPDGNHVYVASTVDDSLAAFSRTPASGALSFIECLKDTGTASTCSDQSGAVDGLEGARGVTLSPDGRHVYVVSFIDSAIAAFSRDSTSGEVSFIDSYFDADPGVDGLEGASDVAVSPDGDHVYVASGTPDSAIVTFSRDSTSGALSFVDCLKDTGTASTCSDQSGAIDGLAVAAGLAIAPDGKHVYAAAAGDDAVSAFSRDETTGALSFVGCLGDTGGPSTCSTQGDTIDGLNGALRVSSSPDGRHVYVTSQFFDRAIAAFSRDETTGALSFVGCLGDTGGPSTCSTQGDTIDGLAGATGVTSSFDGKHVYVASTVDSSLAVFSRNGASGSLSFVELKDDGVDGVDGLAVATGVTVSPDGRHVYVAANTDSAVAAFAREPDTTPPLTTIDAAPSGATSDRTPTIAFSSNDAQFTSGFECSLDGGAFSTCTSPRTIGPLADGPHSFAVRARDTADNVGPPVQRGFEVSTRPPDPVEGKTVNTVPRRGRIRVNTPGPGGYRPLVAGESLPIGTKVDAEKGRVRVITDYNGRLQSMLFYAGRFKIDQDSGRKPIVEIKLIGKLECGRRGREETEPSEAARKKRRGKGRKLWGKGKRGKYKSKGKRGSATVRGTKWLTKDRCDGSTEFKLKQGKIAIDDFGKPGKKNAVLRGKGRYKAKP